eukprot:1147225-Prymnesium_polylepis.3
MLATPDHRDAELWLRYMQTRTPDLLANLVVGGSHGGTEHWLAELRGFMRMRVRMHLGGVHLGDGVRIRDLQLGPMLGEGGFGSVYLARHRILPDRWYAVKKMQLPKLKNSPVGRRQLRYTEREREVLLLLARETRGTRFRDLFVRMVVFAEDEQARHGSNQP